MEILSRNEIIFENILPFIDLMTAIKLGAVCKNWYDRINTYSKLWKRLMKKENIEDPEKWDWLEEEDQWPLGSPCIEKKILMNYRRAYFCLRNNIYKKFDFKYDNCSNIHFAYDGKTFVLYDSKILKVYKVINDSFKLFQIIELKNINFVNSLMTNTEYIVIMYSGIEQNRAVISIYRSLDDKYVSFSEPVIGKGRRNFPELFSDVLIVRSDLAIYAWNIPENRKLFEGYNHRLLIYNDSIFYFLVEGEQGDSHYKLVAYDEEFTLINKVDYHSALDGVNSAIVSDQMLKLACSEKENEISVSIWDKASGIVQVIKASIDIRRIDRFFFADNKLIVTSGEQRNIEGIIGTKLAAYDVMTLNRLWKVYGIDDSYQLYMSYCFNKLLLVKLDFGVSIEIRDPDSGNLLHTVDTKLTEGSNCFLRDMVVSNDHKQSNLTILLYR